MKKQRLLTILVLLTTLSAALATRNIQPARATNDGLRASFTQIDCTQTAPNTFQAATNVPVSCTVTEKDTSPTTDATGHPIPFESPNGTIQLAFTDAQKNVQTFTCTLPASVPNVPSVQCPTPFLLHVSSGVLNAQGLYSGDLTHEPNGGSTTLNVNMRSTTTELVCRSAPPSPATQDQSSTTCVATVTDTSPATDDNSHPLPFSSPTGNVGINTFPANPNDEGANGNFFCTLPASMPNVRSSSCNFGPFSMPGAGILNIEAGFPGDQLHSGSGSPQVSVAFPPPAFIGGHVTLTNVTITNGHPGDTDNDRTVLTGWIVNDGNETEYAYVQFTVKYPNGTFAHFTTPIVKLPADTDRNLPSNFDGNDDADDGVPVATSFLDTATGNYDLGATVYYSPTNAPVGSPSYLQGIDSFHFKTFQVTADNDHDDNNHDADDISHATTDGDNPSHDDNPAFVQSASSQKLLSNAGTVPLGLVGLAGFLGIIVPASVVVRRRSRHSTTEI